MQLDFFDALIAANLTKYQYAAWFIPVSWLPSLTNQSEALHTLERKDITRVYKIDHGDALGAALMMKGRITTTVAQALDEGPLSEPRKLRQSHDTR